MASILRFVADVTTGLTSVMLDGITSNASLLDNHIALNATLVASLYRIVGIEFGALIDLLKLYFLTSSQRHILFKKWSRPTKRRMQQLVNSL